MKVILLHDVAKVGRKNEVKEVSDGYARNFLIARGKAVPATAGAVAALKEQLHLKEKLYDTEEERFRHIIGGAGETVITIPAKASPEGHLFAGLHPKELAAELKVQGYPVREEWLELKAPIKNLGDVKVKLKTGRQTASLNLRIVAESK